MIDEIWPNEGRFCQKLEVVGVGSLFLFRQRVTWELRPPTWKSPPKQKEIQKQSTEWQKDRMEGTPLSPFAFFMAMALVHWKSEMRHQRLGTLLEFVPTVPPFSDIWNFH